MVRAWDRELGRKLRARTILDEAIVLHRKADGTPVALEDRCCHRHLPLSMGVLIGDDLRCSYHGLRYDAWGRTPHVPGQASIRPLAPRGGWGQTAVPDADLSAIVERILTQK